MADGSEFGGMPADEHDAVLGVVVPREGVDLAVAGCDRMFGELSPLQQLFARHGEPEAG